jgi:hypothetical protein
MADTKTREGDGELWQRYFAAAITGVLAGHRGPASTPDFADLAKDCGEVADAALTEVRRRREDPKFQMLIIGKEGTH